MKKIINWFNIIKELPLFTEEAPEPLVDGGPNAPAEVTSKKTESTLLEKPKASADWMPFNLTEEIMLWTVVNPENPLNDKAFWCAT